MPSGLERGGGPTGSGGPRVDGGPRGAEALPDITKAGGRDKISHVDRSDEITFATAVAFSDFVFITVVKCVYTSRHRVTFTRGSLNVRNRWSPLKPSLRTSFVKRRFGL
jgi:hypothetical protein